MRTEAGKVRGSGLRAQGVSRRYGDVAALMDVTLEVAAGETVALVGESGSGKTTLLRLFNGMVRPDSGAVWVSDRAVAAADLPTLRRSIGYVQQEGGLMPHWTVFRNVGLVPRMLGWDSARIQDRAETLLEAVGLDPTTTGDRHPVELSGGQRQRVALARAMAADPDVILLDEPFGALDALTRRDTQQLFRRLTASLRKTVLLVTHDLREAFALADRVAVLRRGRIEQLGDETALRERPASAYVRELLRRGLGA